MGFGFTIIGGDRPDEFLQVKNVLKDGPAAQDGRIAPGQYYLSKPCCGAFREHSFWGRGAWMTPAAASEGQHLTECDSFQICETSMQSSDWKEKAAMF